MKSPSSDRHPSLRAIPPSRAPLSFGALMNGFTHACMARDQARGRDGENALRAEVGRRFAADHVVLTASGTDALRLALEVAFAARGRRRVALPAYSCYALATAAVGANAEVDLYDVDPRTLSPDLDSLTASLLDGADAVVVGHLYGYPADVPSVDEAASSNGAIVIEDAAQEGGGSLNGRGLGTLAPLSILSFGRGKSITCGGGGALLVRDPDLLETAREVEATLACGEPGWHELLRATAEWAFGRPLLYGIPHSMPFLQLGTTRYEEPSPPRRMAAGARGLLEASLRSADEWVRRRRERAFRLRRLLATVPGVELIRPLSGACPGELRLPFQVPDRRKVAGSFLGIAPGYPTTLGALGALRPALRRSVRPTPGAEHLTRTLLTAPTHPLTTSRDLEAIRDWICPNLMQCEPAPSVPRTAAPAFP